jgi:heme A synthase
MLFLYHLHSGLRFVVLLFGALAIAALIWGLVARRPYDRMARLSTMAFVGMLDLQVLIGLVLVLLGIWYPALMGHLMLMVMAAVAAHIFVVLARGSTEPGRAHTGWR